MYPGPALRMTINMGTTVASLFNNHPEYKSYANIPQVGIDAFSVYFAVYDCIPNTLTRLRYNQTASTAVQPKNTNKKYCNKAELMPHKTGTEVT